MFSFQQHGQMSTGERTQAVFPTKMGGFYSLASPSNCRLHLMASATLSVNEVTVKLALVDFTS